MSLTKTLFLDCKSRHDLALLLGIKSASLTYFAFGGGKKYKSFVIPKKNGGVRDIVSPVEGLMAVQKKLVSILEEVYPKPSYINGFVKKGSILKNANPHVGKKVVLNFDLKDFFPSITASRLIGLFRAKPFGFNNEVASILAGILCYKDSLPQGAPTSPIVSNMICLRLDKEMRRLSLRERFVYTRYADDITISTTKKKLPESVVMQVVEGAPIELGKELKKIIEDNYFHVNPSKTRLSFGSKSKYVTGVKVNTIPNVSRYFVRNISGMLHAWEKYTLPLAQAKFRTDHFGGGRSFIQVLRGKLSHIKNIKGDSDLVYRRLYNKFVELENKGKPQLPVTEIEELNKKVFVIQSGSRYGTGFILDQRFLVTCNHTVNSSEIEYYCHWEFPVALHRKSSFRSELASEEFDIAIFNPQSSDLRDPTKSFKSAPDTESVEVQKTYRVLGFPNYTPGSSPHIMKVDVTSLSRNNKHSVLEAVVDRALVAGASGSPVLNDRNEVVGMVQRGAADYGSTIGISGYIFIPIQEIRRCLGVLGL